LPLLLLVLLLHPGNAQAQQRDRAPGLNLGDAVVTGFSGTTAPDPAKPRPANKSAIDLTFIDPEGPSARIVGIGQPGFVWDGRLLQAPKTFDVFAKDVGQVFGVALDDDAAPNVYLAATSVFGLNIVVRGRDGQPERRKKGGPGAGWMKGQFGLDLQGGPGSIYKVDGRTGAVSLLANVTLDGVPNPGPGLGNLAYDSAHKQLFVSDLYTGMIHRVGLNGKDLGGYDHGVTGLGAAKLPPVPFNARGRLNIASDLFNTETPGTWGFAPPGRQVWGLAVHDGRLYYAVAAGPQIWSVGIDQDGGFAADPRWELDVPAQSGPLPVSDIAFSYQGAMILAQRALIAASYDYSAFTRAGEPQVLRFWLKAPNDPPSPGRWKLIPEEYSVGFAGNDRNTNGGVALGYGYGATGALDTTACDAALWTTGQNLRNNPALRSQLAPGGPLVVHGLQGSPADLVRTANTPPTTSYFIDYDDKFDDPGASGHIGSVRVYTTPCTPAVAASGPAVAATPAGIGGGGGGGGGGVCTPTCVCPPGTVLEGKECVKREVICPPPQVFNPATGACVCPPRTKFNGTECVPEIYSAPAVSCRPPLILDPITGLCVPAWQECVPPLVFDPVTHSCACPQGSVMEGGKCVPQICPPPLVPGPCLQTGSLIVTKKIINETPTTPLPPITFPITVTCGPPSGLTVSFNLNDGGSYTVNNIVPVSTCTVAEVPLPPPPPNVCPRGFVAVWVSSPAYSPSNVVVVNGGPPITVTVTNTLTCKKITEGSLVVTKKIINETPTTPLPPITFPITVTCGPPSGLTVSFNLIDNGVHTVSGIVPVSNCTVAEVLPPPPPNVCPRGMVPVWVSSPAYSPSATVPVNGGPPITVTVTNTLTCKDIREGSLVVTKKIINETPTTPLPPITFPITVTCGPPSGLTVSFNLIDNGVHTVSGIVPVSNCTVAEVLPPPPPNVCPRGMVPVWVSSPAYSPSATVPVNGGPPITVTVTNTLKCEKVGEGTLAVTKTVSPDPKGIGLTLTFPITATCTNPNAVYPLNVHGNTSTVPFNLPVGSHCSFTETQPALPKGCTWLPPNFSPANVTIASGLNQETVTNGYRCTDICPPPQVANVDGICMCPPPTVPGPVAGTCLCQQGTTLVDGKCVTPSKCPPPQVANDDGICMCPPPTTLVDGQCVTPYKPLVCRSPLIPNAAGTECVCRAGLVPRGGTCVEPIRCRAPATLNRSGTGCDCPSNMVPRGNTCVEQKRKQRVVPERNPDIRIPGIGFPNTGGPRGGQDSGGPRGGNQGGGLPGRR
jgi:hypothetical protein